MNSIELQYVLGVQVSFVKTLLDDFKARTIKYLQSLPDQMVIFYAYIPIVHEDKEHVHCLCDTLKIVDGSLYFSGVTDGFKLDDLDYPTQLDVLYELEYLLRYNSLLKKELKTQNNPQ